MVNLEGQRALLELLVPVPQEELLLLREQELVLEQRQVLLVLAQVLVAGPVQDRRGNAID